jgi:serine/threonine protein kinase
MMMSASLLRLGQCLKGTSGTYNITKQVSEFVYFARYVLAATSNRDVRLRNLNSNEYNNPVVVKSVKGHWRLRNESDILRRFQSRAPTLRPLLDEIEDPAEPPTIILRYLNDDLTRASQKQRLTRQEIKYIAKRVLEALQVLHEDGYVHTGKFLARKRSALYTDRC